MKALTAPARRYETPATQQATRRRGWTEMNLATVRDAFLMHKRIAGRRGPTLDAYASDLTLFISHVTQACGHLRGAKVQDFTEEVVEAWLTQMETRGLARATMARRLTSLREFARYGLRKRYWTADPTLNIGAIRRPPTLPRPFTPEERDALMALVLEREPAALRACLYYGGLRDAEICDLRARDLVPPAERLAYLRVRGKGGKERVVKLHPQGWAVLAEYVEHKPQDDRRPDSPVFTKRDTGMPWRPWMIRARVATWGRAAGVDACTPHRFRHTYATNLLEGGTDSRVVQDQLGHASLSTTAIYMKVVDASRDAAALSLPAFGGGVD